MDQRQLVPNRWNQIADCVGSCLVLSPSIEKGAFHRSGPRGPFYTCLKWPKRLSLVALSCIEIISNIGSRLGVVYYFLQQDKVNKVNLLSLPPGALIVVIVKTFKGGITPF